MARPRNPALYARLREQAVDYVLTHGITDLSLRPLARELETNARMLIYHFGSREGLMRAILDGLRQREDRYIRSWFQKKQPRSLSAFLLWYWDRLSVPQARPAARLLFEVYALALRNPRQYPGVLTSPLSYWQQLAERVGTMKKLRAAEATLLLAATRGMLLDLCATNDLTRLRQAVRLLARLLDRERPNKQPRS